MKVKGVFVSALISVGIALSRFAAADSDFAFGSPSIATAKLDFRIIIPQVVYFQIGSVAATDRIEWDLTGTEPGKSAVPIAATGGVGDGVDGQMNITLITNAATVTLASDTGGGVLTGPSDTIPFTDITVVDGSTITAPAFDGSTVIATGGVYSATDTWTYTYNDDTVYQPGTYNGTTIYTAATP